jgi:hypothetical protein
MSLNLERSVKAPEDFLNSPPNALPVLVNNSELVKGDLLSFEGETLKTYRGENSSG